MTVQVSFYADPGRTVIIATKKTRIEMIQQGGDKGFMMFWNASFLGWVICRKQGVEKTMEFASEYETDVADSHGPIWFPWTWLPKGMSVRRIVDCKLFAEDVVVGHQDGNDPVCEVAGYCREDVIRRTRVKSLETRPIRMRGGAVHPKWNTRPQLAPSARADY